MLPIYRIAGLTVNLENRGGRTEKQAKPYLCQTPCAPEEADITIHVSEERISQMVKEHPEMNRDDWEYMLTGSDFYTALLAYNGIMLHASCVVADGVAYAFSADSGTGKSTHTSLWLKYLGERAYMLNDDKPALREIDGTIYACGTPWSGKYDYSAPEMIPLGGICFIKRGTENRIKPAAVKDAVFQLFSQTLRKLKQENMERLLDVMESIFAKVPLYELECDISEEAFLTSYQTMTKKD